MSTSARRISCQVLAEELAPVEVACWSATDPPPSPDRESRPPAGSSSATSADTSFEILRIGSGWSRPFSEFCLFRRHLWLAEVVTRAGAGVLIRSEHAHPARIREAVAELLAQATFRDRSRALSAQMHRHDVGAALQGILREARGR